MSQRESGYDRQDRDLYETPEWVTLALLPYLADRPRSILEPACASGKMVRALKSGGHSVLGTDISTGSDFLSLETCYADIIVTNPPYKLAKEFIEHAVHLMEKTAGKVAMLLRTDYDHAATRQHLFGECPIFSQKIVLTKRIIWFDAPGAAPSFNHAWYIWDYTHEGQPTLAYWQDKKDR